MTAGIPALDNTLGALYLAAVLTMALWGAGTVQMYYYFDTYKDDELWLKLHVFIVWAVDTAHQALVLHSNYVYLVREYANLPYLAHLETSLKDSIILTAFICMQVQVIFIMRIWRFSKRNILLTGTVSTLVLGQFVSTIVYYVRAYHFTEFAQLETIFTITRVINVLTALADTSLAAVLVVLLYRSRTGFRNSDSMINRLVTFTVNTGIITAACAITSLVTGLVLPNTLVYVLFYLSICRLYVNSLFATLNSRAGIRTGVYDESTSHGMQSFSMANMRSGRTQRSTNPRLVNISVKTETINDQDGLKGRMSTDGTAPSESDVEVGVAAKSGRPF